MSKVGVHLTIEGRVQGVGFRYFCQKKAFDNSLCGEVKNLSNGNVQIIAEGDQIKIDHFIHVLQNDHPYAQVTHIEKKEMEYTGKYNDFKIVFY
jgi:acylphosphatase